MDNKIKSEFKEFHHIAILLLLLLRHLAFTYITSHSAIRVREELLSLLSVGVREVVGVNAETWFLSLVIAAVIELLFLGGRLLFEIQVVIEHFVELVGCIFVCHTVARAAIEVVLVKGTTSTERLIAQLGYV